VKSPDNMHSINSAFSQKDIMYLGDVAKCYWFLISQDHSLKSLIKYISGRPSSSTRIGDGWGWEDLDSYSRHVWWGIHPYTVFRFSNMNIALIGKLNWYYAYCLDFSLIIYVNLFLHTDLYHSPTGYRVKRGILDRRIISFRGYVVFFSFFLSFFDK